MATTITAEKRVAVPAAEAHGGDNPVGGPKKQGDGRAETRRHARKQ